MSFTHAHVGDLAAALVDDQLDQGTRDLVLLHLGRCPGCRSDVEEQRQLKQRLHALGSPGLPSGLMARLGALSVPERPLEQVHEVLLAEAQPGSRPSLLRHPQRGRRILVGAASLLLVGAGTAVAAGGDGQSPSPVSPSTTSTFSTSFQTPIVGTRGPSGGSSVPLTDPAFGAMTASFHR
jgi:anti-sigma factor RsiW